MEPRHLWYASLWAWTSRLANCARKKTKKLFPQLHRCVPCGLSRYVCCWWLRPHTRRWPMAHARTARHTHSSHTEPRTPSAVAMADGRVQHTSTRRSTALLSTLRTIAMGTPDCLLDGTMLRERAHLTMVAVPDSMAATPNTPRTKMPPRSRCCVRHAFVPLANLSRFGSTACPPDRPIRTDGPCNLSHTATRVHNPDGLAPDGGHPRLYRETLPITI